MLYYISSQRVCVCVCAAGRGWGAGVADGSEYGCV